MKTGDGSCKPEWDQESDSKESIEEERGILQKVNTLSCHLMQSLLQVSFTQVFLKFQRNYHKEHILGQTGFQKTAEQARWPCEGCGYWLCPDIGSCFAVSQAIVRSSGMITPNIHICLFLIPG